MPPIKTLPAWRQGWTWTLIKSAVAVALSILACTAALLWLLTDLVGRLPGWIPAAWLERIFLWVLSHVWLFGPVAGLVLGALVSLGIVAYDARRGRLRRLS
jgi:hypothetical protein